jgi:nucleoside-diphosphate-sugar epimerase
LKKLLIIGGSGLFGKSLIDCGINKKLVKHRIDKIYVISRKKISNKKKYKHIKIEYITKNIENIKKLPPVDYLIYALKNKNIKSSQSNFDHFVKLLKKLSKTPKILFTSSGAIYGKNNDKIKRSENTKINYRKINQLKGYKKNYALEKVYIENRIIELGLSNFDVSIARCFNFLGRHSLRDGQAIGHMITQGLTKKVISINNSNNVYRGYLNTDDLIDWLIIILKNSNKSCPIFNVGSDRAINIKLLGKKIAKIFNKKFKLKKRKIFETDYYIPSINKAKKLLKLKISINLNDSLNSFIK